MVSHFSELSLRSKKEKICFVPKSAIWSVWKEVVAAKIRNEILAIKKFRQGTETFAWKITRLRRNLRAKISKFINTCRYSGAFWISQQFFLSSSVRGYKSFRDQLRNNRNINLFITVESNSYLLIRKLKA